MNDHEETGTMRYCEMMNVGACKYVVNFHDGQDTHSDGSPFYNVRIFSNKRKKDAFIRELQAQGYRP